MDNSVFDVPECEFFEPSFDSTFFLSKMQYSVGDDFMNMNKVEREIAKELVDRLIENDYQFDDEGIVIDFETEKCREIVQEVVLGSLMNRLEVVSNKSRKYLASTKFITVAASSGTTISFEFNFKSSKQDLQFMTYIIKHELDKLETFYQKQDAYLSTLSPIERMLVKLETSWE